MRWGFTVDVSEGYLDGGTVVGQLQIHIGAEQQGKTERHATQRE